MHSPDKHRQTGENVKRSEVVRGENLHYSDVCGDTMETLKPSKKQKKRIPHEWKIKKSSKSVQPYNFWN